MWIFVVWLVFIIGRLIDYSITNFRTNFSEKVYIFYYYKRLYQLSFYFPANEDSIFLRHLELDPPPADESQPKAPAVVSTGSATKGGRTPFTTTKRLCRQSGTSFGFSIAWTHPPRLVKL